MTATELDAGAVLLAAFWNGAELAKSGRVLDKATTQTNFKSAQYGHTVTAAAAINTSVALPWTQFLADQAAAEDAWWTTNSGDYLTFVGNVNTEVEAYQTSVGTEYVTQVAALTTANVTRTTAVALAGEARTVSRANHAAGYIQEVSSQIKTYLQATAVADRDLADGGEQSNYDTARSSAADAYRTAVATEDAQFDLDLATANKTHTAALYSTDPGSEGAETLFSAARDAALRDFDIFEATANADMLAAIAKLTHYDSATSTLGYAASESASHAAAMSAFAVSSPSPWSQQSADTSAAESTRTTSIAQEETILAVARSTASATQSNTTSGARHDASQSTHTAAGAYARTEAAITQTIADGAAATAPTDAEEAAVSPPSYSPMSFSEWQGPSFSRPLFGFNGFTQLGTPVQAGVDSIGAGGATGGDGTSSLDPASVPGTTNFLTGEASFPTPAMDPDHWFYGKSPGSQIRPDIANFRSGIGRQKRIC